MLSRIRAKAEAGKRLDRADGLWLLTEAPLLDLGALAQEARFRAHPGAARDLRHRLEPELHQRLHHRLPVLRLLPQARRHGGLHADGRRRCWRRSSSRRARARRPCCCRAATTRPCRSTTTSTLVRETRRRFPSVTPHFFTASEIRTMAEVSGLTVPEVLDRAQGGGPDARCPAAAPRCSPSGCASASSPRRAGPAPGSTCTARRTGRASSPPRP